MNTRISAVIALEKLAVGKREFHVKLALKEQEEERRLSWEETLELLRKDEDAYERATLRVLVYENPYAALRLPDDLFTGPYDVRWGREADEPFITRLYNGPEIQKLEDAEHDLELDVGPLQKKTKRQHEEAESTDQSRKST